ncbi:capsular biosynthesis protein, partial [Bacillus sp. JJ1609]
MKKICILSAVNIRHMSLISLYTEKLKRDGIEFDIIYMDKYLEEEEFPAKNKYVFHNKINQSDNKIKKVLK